MESVRSSVGGIRDLKYLQVLRGLCFTLCFVFLMKVNGLYVITQIKSIVGHFINKGKISTFLSQSF